MKTDNHRHTSLRKELESQRKENAKIILDYHNVSDELVKIKRFRYALKNFFVALDRVILAEIERLNRKSLHRQLPILNPNEEDKERLLTSIREYDTERFYSIPSMTLSYKIVYGLYRIPTRFMYRFARAIFRLLRRLK